MKRVGREDIHDQAFYGGEEVRGRGTRERERERRGKREKFKEEVLTAE